ncbi:DUF4252 domain-containing protein [Fulvivirga sediminis]|uniref:DUF4252 domain-containing protein n=1 Tax=Fulvivirga sediminis TaxID=2803949 RepID=A0A937FCP9_9BACT|nr:DUF4252 domain-containing protein [Fulvivirga sediminis]MBL3658008.1 DUF4252 domain-containing protein [Fulvivirga sediminis]
MKRSILVLSIGVLLSFSAQGQDAISKFFSKYENDEEFTQVSVNSRMFELFTNLEMESKEDQEVMNAISKLKGIRILAKEDAKDGKKLYKEAFQLLPKEEYGELMSVRDGSTDLKFLIKESGGKINELLMISGGEKEFFILSLFGEIDLKQIAKISKSMDIQGLEGLEKLNNKKE